MKKVALLILCLLPATSFAAPLAATANGQRFGFCLGVDAHIGPADMPPLVSFTQAVDLGNWYEYKSAQGVYKPIYIQHELSFFNAPSQTLYQLGTVLWGYYGNDSTFNEPFWLASLAAATQVQEYILNASR